MAKEDIIWFGISFIVGLVAYLTSLNIYIAVVVFVVFIAYYFLLIRKRFKKYFEQIYVINLIIKIL